MPRLDGASDEDLTSLAQGGKENLAGIEIEADNVYDPNTTLMSVSCSMR